MMPLTIYLADLTHTGLGVATEAFPLNIGLVASYAKKKFGQAVDIRLFKYPEDLEAALREFTPQVLGCSNYAWNSHLSYHFLRMAKALDPLILTVFGGTNYPFDPENQIIFLKKRPLLDLHLFYEGELGFAELCQRFLSLTDRRRIFEEPIPSSQFLHKETGQLISGSTLPRIRDLDEIPSPYATGLLDRFFDGKLTPLLETARGCPFTCNFCNAGAAYFTKVHLFSDAYVRQEWEYVAKKASSVGVGHLTLTDNNFGMIPRDEKTAALMLELKGRYGWPRTVTAWTGKNSKERVIEVTRLLGDTLSINMAVQSMDLNVLKKIKRSNIRLADYQAIAEELNAQGRPQVAEVIVPLPGETWSSHVSGIRKLLDSSVSTIIVHTLQMLHGTPYKDDGVYVKEHQFVRKHRLVPLDFGIYAQEPIFDTEEVAVATSTFSLEEYVASRKLLFLMVLSYNSTVFDPLKKYLRSQGCAVSDWILFLFSELPRFPAEILSIWDAFEKETLSELWDSQEELIRFYSRPENYERLVAGDIGGNVLFKHQAWLMTAAGAEWVETVFTLTKQFLQGRLTGQISPEILLALEELKRFILYRLRDAFDLSAGHQVYEEPFLFDVPAWLMSDPSASLLSFRSSSGMRLRFSFGKEQVELKREALVRYGNHRSGVIKLIQRLGSIQRFLRHASYEESYVPCDNRLKPILE